MPHFRLGYACDASASISQLLPACGFSKTLSLADRIYISSACQPCATWKGHRGKRVREFREACLRVPIITRWPLLSDVAWCIKLPHFYLYTRVCRMYVECTCVPECVYVCMSVQVHACGGKRTLSSVPLHLILWDRVSHETSHPWFVRPTGSSSLPLTPGLVLVSWTCYLTHGLYMGDGDLNSDSDACAASISATSSYIANPRITWIWCTRVIHSNRSSLGEKLWDDVPSVIDYWSTLWKALVICPPRKDETHQITDLLVVSHWPACPPDDNYSRAQCVWSLVVYFWLL